MYTIEKDIPIPPPSGREAGAEIRETLEAMAVGDSFVLPVKQRLKATAVAKQFGMMIATRKISDDQARVWLVSKNGHAV